VAGDLAQRIFETSALHCTLLSDTCADFERVGFRPWEHYVPFDTAQDAVLMTKKILAEPKLSLEIADRALAWVQPHTWDARGEYILNSVFKP
jgi:spore maturation protein CgeB